MDAISVNQFLDWPKTFGPAKNSLGPVEWCATKGQLISECFFDFLNFPKKHQKIWQISAQESKKWSNQQSINTFL